MREIEEFQAAVDRCESVERLDELVRARAGLFTQGSGFREPCEDIVARRRAYLRDREQIAGEPGG